MTMSISRRALVRLISFGLALLAVLGGLAWTARREARAARTALEYHYLQSVADLATYAQNIDTGLEKILYAGTPAMLSQLSSKLWREAGYAKNALDALPVGYLSLQNTNKLLSQVGDYCVSLAAGFSEGSPITEEQRQNLAALKEYCGGMLQEVYALSDAVQTGSLQLTAVESDIRSTLEGGIPAPSVAEGFSEFEEGFSAYPTLIYDGPFSDHILQKEPEHLKDRPTVSREAARARAASLLGVQAADLTDTGDEEGRMPSYGFSCSMGADGSGGTADISLTKAGGLLCYLLRSRMPGEQAVSAEEAIQAAKQFLAQLDIPEVRTTYYEVGGGIMTINFAAVQDGVLLYPDLIKVGVALDNAEILSFDARGFLTNHTDRQGLSPVLTAEQARASLSSLLAVESSQLCLVPTDGLNEVLCWEFKTSAPDGQTVLVYVNAATGAEENILLLMIGENGQLTI